MRIRRLALIPALCVLGLLVAPAVMAAEWITPAPLTHDQEIVLQQKNDHQWSAVVKAKGDILHIRYSSPSPVDLYVVPLWNEQEKHLGRDILFTLLPAGEHIDLQIDLSRSPRWSPWLPAQYVILNVHDTKTNADIEALQIERGSPFRLPLIAWRQFMLPEQFTAFLYHAPVGYQLLGAPFGLLLGTVMLAFVIILFLFRSRFPSWRRMALYAIVGSVFLYQFRLSADLLRLTVAHAQTWFTQESIDPAGSLQKVADMMRSTKVQHPILFDCTDDNQYSAMFVRYSAYPLRVVTDVPKDGTVTHVLAHQTPWTYDGDQLHCKSLNAKARRLAVFPDGSVLFVLDQSAS